MSAPSPRKHEEASHSNFIRQIIEADLMAGKYATRKWNGKPGSALSLHGAPADPAKVRTGFPPEPNGYLHYGHAKSIFLNFGLAREYGGACHLRFDDTNPAKEETEYVDSIRDAVKWLGFSWEDPGGNTNEYYASDYFEYLYQFAEELVRRGHAYVDSLSAEQMRALRGTLTEPGKNSPYRERGVEESLKLFREMRQGKFADGEHVLRAKIDMASPNINLRDPAMYRIRHAAHHRTGDHWCIYPTYDWAHGVSDALENITHSLCTLEFEDHRPLYEWFNECPRPPHGGARSGEARHRELPAGEGGGMRGTQPPAEAGMGQAQAAALSRAVDRARGFLREPAEGLLSSLPRQQGAPALRLRRRVHRLRQGRGRQGHGSALQVRSGHEIGHGGRGDGQGEREKPLGEREEFARGGSGAVAPAVQSPASGSGRQRARAGPESGFEEARHRTARGRAEGLPARGAVPVRAPRLFHRRLRRLQAGRAEIQSRGDAERQLGEIRPSVGGS